MLGPTSPAPESRVIVMVALAPSLTPARPMRLYMTGTGTTMVVCECGKRVRVRKDETMAAHAEPLS